MSVQKNKKLNKLVSTWPKGAVYTTAYLNVEGYSRGLLNRYRKSKWIQQLGTGAYTLYEDEANWAGALRAIQHQLDLNVHIGGKSALEQMGHAHYLSPQLKKLYLYCQGYQNLPNWMVAHDWGVDIVYAKTMLFQENFAEGFTQLEIDNFNLKASGAERAALEMLYHVPKRTTFQEAMLIMENLTTLRPRMVQTLLERCNFVKIKRLFMYMADICNHAWFKKIETSRIDLGKGTRQIIKNGRLDRKYRITVPDEYQDNEDNT
jgi:hypothetical protein